MGTKKDVFVSTLIEIQIQEWAGNFLTRQVTIGSSRRTLSLECYGHTKNKLFSY